MPGKSRAGHKPTKGERLDAMARKKEERAVRNAHRRQRNWAQQTDESYARLKSQLTKLGLQIRQIPGDGNCLFRALGDQLEGHGRHHLKHRHDVVQFMTEHRADFEPFVEDDVPFERHLAMLKKSATYAGNDALVAFSRLHKKNVIIHQEGSPVWQVPGSDLPSADQLHISYHNGDHYCSVRRIGDCNESPANVRLNDLGAINYSAKSVPHHAPCKPGPSWEENGQSYDFTYEDDNQATTSSQATASAYRDTTDVEACVMQATGCLDERFVRETLQDMEYDVDLAISHILHFFPSSHSPPGGASVSVRGALWEENGTGSRLFGSESTTGAKPKHKQQVSSAQRKRDRKLEKKARKTERNRNQVNNWSSSDSDDVTVVTQAVSALQI